MIDLHLHTTASDGRLAPAQLIARAAAAGAAVVAVTDHDTTDGIDEADAEAARHGLTVVPGIEITAVENGRDVHMLGYFFDRADEKLGAFLAGQRLTRIERIAEIARRLQNLGMPLDVDGMLAAARRDNRRSIGRPALARAMIEAGYVADTRDAFDRWLSPGCPAFVERAGASPEAVSEIVHAAGGLVSLAQPGRTRIDGRLEALRDAGLDAIEVYHPDHDAVAIARYQEAAHRLGALVTGGSDFHADPSRSVEPGTAHLPRAEWTRLLDASAAHARG